MSRPILIRSRILVATTVALGLACSAPSTPTTVPGEIPPEFRPQAADFEMVDVNVQGRVIDADRDRGVVNAVVTPSAYCTPRSCPDLRNPPAPSATAGANGVFNLVANIPKTWTVLHLRITRDGFEPVHDLVRPYEVTAAQLWVSPTLTLSAGESLTISKFLFDSTCGWEDILCRRVLVRASPDGPVDVEVTGGDGQNFGISSSAGEFKLPSRQVTVSSGEVWVYAGTPAPTAFRPVFEQSVTVIARRH